MSDDSGVHVIRVHLSSISQLFNSLDPSPFVGRDLDVNAESFIMEWAEEHPARGAFRLEILLNQCDDLAAARDRVVQAVHAYFLEREQLARRDFRRLMGEGRLSLAIGLVFLAVCLGVSRALEAHTPGSGLLSLVSESLWIGGWVAMWRPLEIFLYDWWPLLRRIRLLRRLSVMEVHLQRIAGAPSEKR
ncbi:MULTISPECIES: hypothetical protein [Marinobacter]|uniref:Uncharacterized protein n=1 Tax=Marinobacter profundi TaxID=2666256 RepID=A0A2G1UR05_9GAMM|nr:MULTISPECIES: hypothetical protein [Marinobacter]MBD3655516.1 hypothetical protein [Marinobacter sp.]PHQ16937.1 hypothetical protein CLH61_02935 [Marinobacter profundi]